MTDWSEDLEWHTGDALAVLKTMPDESVHCVVTSPPYWMLRDYGVAGQIGLEKSVDEFVAKLVEVFREVRRVLRKDGTCWVNLGSSYASSCGSDPNPSPLLSRVPACDMNDKTSGKESFFSSCDSPDCLGIGRCGLCWCKLAIAPLIFKAKDLISIPQLVAFALQADGWWLRQDIIYSKSNPMPESVTDRCTKSHEYLFLLTKSPRYYYDAQAIMEPITESSSVRLAQPNLKNQAGSNRVPGKTNGPMKAVATRIHSGWASSENYNGQDPRCKPRKHGANSRMNVDRDPAHSSERKKRKYDGTDAGSNPDSPFMRNKRDVWRLATQSFRGAHFATFPEKLVEPCVLAGTGKGGVVLDPFAGSGTVALVSLRLGRKSIGIELNPKYSAIAMDRIEKGMEKAEVKGKRGLTRC